MGKVRDEGIMILLLPSEEKVIGWRDVSGVWRRWTTGEKIEPTHFMILPFEDFFQNNNDYVSVSDCPDLAVLKEMAPDWPSMLRLSVWRN